MKLPSKMTPRLSKIIGYTLICLFVMLLVAVFPKVFLFLIICVVGGMGVLYLHWGYTMGAKK